MAQYKTGKVNVTNGSNTITGIDTTWSTLALPLQLKLYGSTTVYNVSGITNNTTLTLTTNYAGSTASGASYQLTQDFSANYNYPLPQNGDYDAGDWISQAITMIDNDMAYLPLPTGTLNNSWTINSSKANVTSTLTFGRTTGGDATISWDGTSLTTNKSLTINSSTTVAMNRFITSNGLAGHVHATRTSAANTDAYIGFLDAKESWAYYFRTDSSHVWKVNNIDKMYLNDTTLTTTGNLYVGGNVSAESFTDRTPFFQGDALSEIMNIKGKDGEIDHSSLPSFARKEITKRRFEDVELTTEVDAKDAYMCDTRTVEVKGVEQEEIIEDSKKLKDTVYEDEKTGKFYEKYSVGEVKIKDGKPYQSIDVGEEIEQGRDLGAMISMLTVAVQQLKEEINELKKQRG